MRAQIPTQPSEHVTRHMENVHHAAADFCVRYHLSSQNTYNSDGHTKQIVCSTDKKLFFMWFKSYISVPDTW